jgi:hypothetical protein
VLDDFGSVEAWAAAPAEGVNTTIAADGGTLRVDIDFHGGGGWALVRRPLDLELPANYALSFRIRGDLPPNTLELKLTDAGGENVWWSTRREFRLGETWQTVTVRKRHITFAWGPAGGGEPARAAALEIAFTAGSGGRGRVWLDDLAITELPPARPFDGVARVWASAGETPSAAVDGDPATLWSPPAGSPAWLALDLGHASEIGGVVLTWAPGCTDLDYEVQASDDLAHWTDVRAVHGSNGGLDAVAMPDVEARFLRVALARAAGVARLAEIEVMAPAFGASANAVYAETARRAPRGRYPRAYRGEQVYWTVVGAYGSPHEALLSECGAIEVEKAGFSVEPFVHIDGALVTWADVESAQSLAEGYLPVPTVTWRHPRVTLDVTAVAAGDAGSSSLLASYTLRNPGAAALRATLYLAVRPLQVNPPTQFLNVGGGAARVRSLSFADGCVYVGERCRVLTAPPPDAWGAATSSGGDVSEFLASGMVPPSPAVTDPDESASGALAFTLEVSPGGERTVVIEAPFPGGGRTALAAPRDGGGDQPPAVRGDAAAAFAAAHATARAQWREKLNRVTVSLPAEAGPLADTLRSNLAYILINRDGAAIQPGSRAYERSWIRDGSLTSTALLRLGHAGAVRGFIEWFAPFQYPSGKVPCCVDARGADPVPENDSHGQLLYLLAEYHAFTGDRALVEAHWSAVRRAVDYIDVLRRQRRTDEFRSPGREAFFGLLPASISHEGYSAKPMHSYWDDFWALRGLGGAVLLARALGREHDATRFAALRDEFRGDLFRSLDLTIAAHGIDYIPGCAELGDFDPTSTTIALDPGGELDALPRAALLGTFERYWRESVARRDGTREWDVYTPYEWRTVGALVRLGWRERALAMLDFFMRDRRPPGWNHWAEVVDRDPRRPRFIGDMPHTWVGSDFIRSLLDVLAYERGDALVLAAGVPMRWLAAPGGVSVTRLATRFGPLTFCAAAAAGTIVVEVDDGLSVPPGGVVLDLPLEAPPRHVTVNGGRRPANDPIVVRSLPARVEVAP